MTSTSTGLPLGNSAQWLITTTPPSPCSVLPLLSSADGAREMGGGDIGGVVGITDGEKGGLDVMRGADEEGEGIR